jgi:hypothetical protein
MARFHLYRYQLLPIEQEVQLDFDSHVLHLDELKQRKNEFFVKTLAEMKKLEWSRADIKHKMVYNAGNSIAFLVGANRGQTIETEDFERLTIDDWPSALVAIDNEPTVQMMAIEVEHRAFHKTRTLAGILQDNLNKALRQYLLHISIMPIFDKAEFWQIVSTYKGQITRVRFDMVSPNMSNIAASLKVDLHELNRSTNVQHTTLELKSDKRNSLTLSPDDETISSLVDYSSKGGGNISVKVRGLQKIIQTSDSTKEINAGDIEISVNSPEQLPETMKMLNGLMRL